MITGLRAPLSDLTCLAFDIGPDWSKKPEVVVGPEPGVKGKMIARKEYDCHSRSSCSKDNKLQLGTYLSNEGLMILSH